MYIVSKYTIYQSMRIFVFFAVATDYQAHTPNMWKFDFGGLYN